MIETSAVKYNGRRPASWWAAMKNSYSSQVSNTFVLFKKDQILEELVAHRGAPAVHGQASAAEETLSSSTGVERRVQLDEDVAPWHVYSD